MNSTKSAFVVDELNSKALLLVACLSRVTSMETDIQGLEQRIETLISECKRLSTENQSLKTEQGELLTEKTQLKEKNRLACSRLEKIVEKLRTLEDQ